MAQVRDAVSAPSTHGCVVKHTRHAPAGELLDTLPPGVDEAVAISRVVQITKSPEYAHFTRIIFDTAPTGHTLRLLTLPDFLDASLGDCHCLIFGWPACTCKLCLCSCRGLWCHCILLFSTD